MTIIIAMCLYAFTMSITPGPTNIITMTIGVNYGFKKALPFVLGSVLGFTSLLLVMGFGLGKVAAENELFLQILNYSGAFFICYMGYKIARAHPKVNVEKSSLPGFMQGAILQWFNPKSWIATLAGIGAFKLVGKVDQFALFVVLYIIIGFLCVLTWAYGGSKIAKLIRNDNNLRLFNQIMGIGLIGVAVYLLSLQIH